MADRWTWTPQEWERIELRAREERVSRALSRFHAHGTCLHRVERAVADGAALELRQWAQVAAWRRAGDVNMSVVGHAGPDVTIAAIRARGVLRG